jgi:hypothetical protein
MCNLLSSTERKEEYTSPETALVFIILIRQMGRLLGK